jgi:hypothetical protein
MGVTARTLRERAGRGPRPPGYKPRGSAGLGVLQCSGLADPGWAGSAPNEGGAHHQS